MQLALELEVDCRKYKKPLIANKKKEVVPTKNEYIQIDTKTSKISIFNLYSS